MEAVALGRFAVNRSVLRLTPGSLWPAPLPPALLPPALAETLPHLPKVEGSFAVVCSGNTCRPPVQSAEELAAILR